MNKRKSITVSIDTLGDYVQLLNGVFEMTDTEMEVLTYFLKAAIANQKGETDRHPFEPAVKRQIARAMDREQHYFLNGYIKSLKEKGVLISQEESGFYAIHPLLLPQGEKEICINLNWNT